MRILLVNHYAFPPTQPGGTRHFSLARELMALGHHPVIAASGFDHITRTDRLGPAEAVRRSVHGGVPFIWLRTPAYQGSGGAARLWNLLVFARAVEHRLPEHLDGRPDVIVGSSPHLFGARAALRLARRLRVPFVLEVRDVWPQSLVEVMGVPPWHPLVWVMARIERELYREADHIVTLLPGIGARVAERGGNPADLTWVPNGIDLDLVPPVAEPGDRDPFTFMYAGSHGVTNALDVLVDAAALLQARRDRLPRKLRLVLLGTGPEKPRLEARARDEGVEGLEFLPPVPKLEVYRILAGADAFWVSSQASRVWQHGISFNKLYDFMAMARPTVIGMDCPGNPIAEGGCGIIVRPGDPAAMAEGMEQLLAAGPERRREMGRRGRAHVQAHFDLRVLAGRFAGALEAAVLARTGRAHAS
ncbi:MAG: glycosyltransferase family 4 protein [Holophaga sp.]|jgi:glycosyltransferase involved in cell wall biosynthesis